MKELVVKGIITPIVTPFFDDETINHDELRNQVNRLIDGGVHGIFCFGTNGEGYILSGKEKQEILRTVIEEVNNRVPVYAGTGCVSTKETIEQSKMAEKLGADALSIITPSFAAASQEELYAHYLAVAKSVNIPIVLYNIPARTGNKLLPETVDRLACIENIVGVKDSSGDWNNMLEYLKVSEKHPGFAVLSGNDSLILDCLKNGGSGAIAGCSNVYPGTLSSIFDLYEKGDIEKAEGAQSSISTLRACFKFGNPNTIVKMAVELLGNKVGKCRAPFNYVPAEGIEALKEVLEENKRKGMN